MDDTDFRILQAMGFNPYLPGLPPADSVKPARLAKRVGLGLKATKERITRLEQDGIIAGYQAFPNLRHFPLSWRSFHFRVPEDRKARFLDALEPVEGVVGSFDFIGRDVCVDLCFRDEAEMRRRVRLISDLAGAQPWEFYDNALPAAPRPLTLLDWRIVKALRHDARRPLADVAREMRVTTRTVKNRFDRMVEEGSLWILPQIDYGRIPGFIPFALLVYARVDAGAKAIDDVRVALSADTLYSWTPPAREMGHLGVFLRARTTSEVEARRRSLLASPGVERVEVLLPAGVRMSLAWLDEAIERRIGEMAPGAVGGPPVRGQGEAVALGPGARKPLDR